MPSIRSRTASYTGISSADLFPLTATNVNRINLSHARLRGPVPPEIAMGPATSRTIDFSYNDLECPTTKLETQLLAGCVLSGNLLCDPDNPMQLLPCAQALLPNCIMLPCKPGCYGLRPTSDAWCTNKKWVIERSIDIGTGNSTNNSTVIIGGDTIIKGNINVPKHATLTIKAGAILQVDGCVSLNGSIVVDISQQNASVIANSSQITILKFQDGLCDAAGEVTVAGLIDDDPCRLVSASPKATTTNLAIAFTVLSTGTCDQVPAYSGSPDSQSAANDSSFPVVAVVVSVVVVVGVAIIVVVVFALFRDRLIPSYRLNRDLRKQ